MARIFRKKKAPNLKDNFYKAFEDRYRGSRELILSRLQVYLDFLRPLAGCFEKPQAVDLGCGRGEFLEVLQSAGFQAHGVDLNEGMLEPCHQLGLSVEKREAVEFLRYLPVESQSVVSAFHLVEHIHFDELLTLVSEAFRVLKPGGLLILETPNPENLTVATHNFYFDPTHKNPIPPLLLSFVVEHKGFERVKIMKLQEPFFLNEKSEIGIAILLNGVSPDYSVVGQKDGSPNATRLLDEAFKKNHGVGMPEMAARFDETYRREKQDLRFSLDSTRQDLDSTRQQFQIAQRDQNKALNELAEKIERFQNDLMTELSDLTKRQEGKVRELADVQQQSMQHIQELGSYLGQVQDMMFSPWLNYIPAPLSWPILLFKARGIRRPQWFPLSFVAARRKPGFWRRLQKSVSKRIKKIRNAWDFDHQWYLEKNPEVLTAGINPLMHYIDYGRKEGRLKNSQYKGYIGALARMVKAIINIKIVPPVKITYNKHNGLWCVIVLDISEIKNDLELKLYLESRDRKSEFSIKSDKGYVQDHKILIKLPAGVQILKVACSYLNQKPATILKKVIYVKDKFSESNSIYQETFEKYIDISSQSIQPRGLRKFENKIRKIRKKFFNFNKKDVKLKKINTSHYILFSLNRRSRIIFKKLFETK